MTFTLAETIEVLERTPAVLDSLLRGSSPTWHRTNEGPETWSAFDVVGHLIHGEETDWVPRARMIEAESGVLLGASDARNPNGRAVGY